MAKAIKADVSATTVTAVETTADASETTVTATETPVDTTADDAAAIPTLPGISVIGADGRQRPATEADVLKRSATHMVLIDGQRLPLAGRP